MDPYNPLLPASLGVAFLILAYLFSRATSSVVDDHLHAPENSDFSASTAVQLNSATILDYTPPSRKNGHKYAASIGRVFDNLQLESGSFVRPDVLQVAQGLRQDNPLDLEVPSVLRQATPGPSSTPGSSFEPGCAGIPGRPSTTARASPRGGASTPGPSTPPRNRKSLFVQHPTTSSGTPARACSAPPSSAAFFGLKPMAVASPARSSSRAPQSRIATCSNSGGEGSPAPAPSASSHAAKSRQPKIRLFTRKTRVCSKNANHLNVLPNGEHPKTAYFRSLGDERLARPPHAKLATMGLQVGDIHIHITPTGKPQLWLYQMCDGENPKWEVVEPGYKRPLDGRNLSLTGNQNPFFVGDNWAHRNINDTNKRENRRGQGRAVDTEDDGSSDEDADGISLDSEED